MMDEKMRNDIFERFYQTIYEIVSQEPDTPGYIEALQMAVRLRYLKGGQGELFQNTQEMAKKILSVWHDAKGDDESWEIISKYFMEWIAQAKEGGNDYQHLLLLTLLEAMESMEKAVQKKAAEDTAGANGQPSPASRPVAAVPAPAAIPEAEQAMEYEPEPLQASKEPEWPPRGDAQLEKALDTVLTFSAFRGQSLRQMLTKLGRDNSMTNLEFIATKARMADDNLRAAAQLVLQYIQAEKPPEKKAGKPFRGKKVA